MNQMWASPCEVSWFRVVVSILQTGKLKQTAEGESLHESFWDCECHILWKKMHSLPRHSNRLRASRPIKSYMSWLPYHEVRLKPLTWLKSHWYLCLLPSVQVTRTTKTAPGFWLTILFPQGQGANWTSHKNNTSLPQPTVIEFCKINSRLPQTTGITMALEKKEEGTRDHL